MKNTGTRAAATSSSIWGRPDRWPAGVKRSLLASLIRWASSQTMTSMTSGSSLRYELKYLNCTPARRPTTLRTFSVKALEPVAWWVTYPSRESSATRLRAITDLPVPGPPRMRKTAFSPVREASATLARTELKATRCSSRRT